MTDTLNLNSVLVKFDESYQRLELESKELLALGSEVTVQTIRGFLDSWEGMRSDVFRFRVKVNRLYQSLNDEYKNKLRESLKGGHGITSLNRPTHFEERKSNAETENLSLFMEVRKTQRILEESDSLLEQIRLKERWLSQIRFEAMEEDKRRSFTASNEYSSRG